MVIDAAYALPCPASTASSCGTGARTAPASGAGAIRPSTSTRSSRLYGDYPLPHGWAEAEGRAWGCDIHDGSRAALEDLPQRLSDAVDLKTRVVLGELQRQDADLVFAVFHEGHCAGHQLWHFMDETSPWYEPDAPESLKNGVRSVYARLDRSLGQILEAVEPDTHVFVVLTRGMRRTSAAGSCSRRSSSAWATAAPAPWVGSVRSRLPAAVRRTMKTVVRGPLRDRLKSATGTSQHPLENPRRKPPGVRCGANGAIRLNVRGREPFGSIEPGAEYDAACAELTRELEALRDTEIGEPVVRDVVRADEIFGDRYHPNLPDLIVRFRERGVISSVRSPRIGTVSEPARDRHFARSGEHTRHVRLWYLGPSVTAGRPSREGTRRISPRPSSSSCRCPARPSSRAAAAAARSRTNLSGGVLPHTAQPLVSICMPAYNAAPWIGEAIESALAQTWEDFELVVVRLRLDGRHPRDRPVVHGSAHASRAEQPASRRGPEPQPCDPAVGRGVRQVPPRRRRPRTGLRRGDGRAGRSRTSEIGLVFSPREILVEKDAGEEAAMWSEQYAAPHESFDGLEANNDGHALFRQLVDAGIEDNWIGEPSAVMVARSSLDDDRLFSGRLHQASDLDLWLRIMLRCRVGFVARPLCVYRYHDSSTTVTNRKAGRGWLDRLWTLEALLQESSLRPDERAAIERLRRAAFGRALRNQVGRISRGQFESEFPAYLRYRALASIGRAPSDPD